MKVIGTKKDMESLVKKNYIKEEDIESLKDKHLNDCYIADITGEQKIDILSTKNNKEDRQNWMLCEDYDEKAESLDSYEKLKKIADEKFKANPSYFEREFYWDYSDGVDISELAKYKTYEEFSDHVLEELQDYNYEYECELCDSIYDEFKDDNYDLWMKLSDEDEDEMRDYLMQYMCIDYNVEDLISRTSLYVNIMPYQDENLNCEGGDLYDPLNRLYHVALGQTDDLDEYQSNEVLERLFTSQGYNITNDSIDWKKALEDENGSKFLKSFYQEMINADIEYTYCQFLIFLAEISIEEYYGLKSGKLKMIYDGGTCGLFNPVHGSGSILEVELEKPFEIQFTGEEDFNAIQVEGVSSYGYNVNEVYGLCGEAWTGAEYQFEKIDE